MSTQPDDAEQRRAAPPVVCYDVNSLPKGLDREFQEQWRNTLEVVDTVVVPPRDASTFKVPAGYGFRIRCVQGPQVGDLNLWYQHDLSERFFSGKTRQLHASHLTRGDRLWSSLPALRAMATITHDTLEWYGWDADGGGVHDVIGTRCDPYTNRLLKQVDYHYCCHSNLTRALARELNVSTADAEHHIHDVLNVFMCTGFTLDTHQYFMKASPVRPGDFIEFMAEFDLLGALSSCPGGNCGSEHSSDSTPCYPLEIEILKPDDGILGQFAEKSAKRSVVSYDRSHGIR
ncbi:MAG: urea carboxylase-associated family protein [Granulosicoccus sp.]